MRLVSFSIKNYRSITKAESIQLSDLTVLIGPNNEGKSNMLKGMSLGLILLSENLPRFVGQRNRVYRRRSRDALNTYEWVRDYPLSLQSIQPDGKTTFSFEFELTTKEIVDFKKRVKNQLKNNLIVSVAISSSKIVNFEVIKKGKVNKVLSKKKELITKFISQKLNFHYIPAIRSEDDSLEAINSIISQELKKLHKDPNYLLYRQKLKELEIPLLANISKTVTKSLVNFLPQVKKVVIKLDDEEENYMPYSMPDIKIDDGNLTDLRFKGDGVKSLAAISLIKYAITEAEEEKNIILAIEEPEAHLHPKATHELNKILGEMSLTQQVIIATHSPILVDKVNIKNNILVINNKATCAKSISEIRDLLGVRIPDNLSSAELVLMVEGASDQTIINAVINKKSPILKKALEDKRLIIANMEGVHKYAYLLNLYKNIHLVKIFLFIDGDGAATECIKKAKEQGLLKENEYCLAKLPNKESELEDLFNPELYVDEINQKIGLNIDINAFKKLKNKWTDKIRKIYNKKGQWTDSVEIEIKKTFAEIITSKMDIALTSQNKDVFDNLIKQLEFKLKN